MNPNPRRENLKPFKKGQSGNPKGQPRKIPGIDKLLSTISETDYEAVIKALFVKAKKGDVRAAEVIFDRAFGKAKQTIDVTTIEEKQVMVIGGQKIEF